MQRASEILGLPVLCEKTLKRIGSVDGIAYHAGRGSIDGLYVRKTGFSMQRSLYSMDEIALIGEVSVLIKATRQRERKRADKKPSFASPVRARDLGGRELGLMRDILFDARSGKVEALEISRGVLDDMLSGRLLAWRFAPVEIADEIIVLPDKAEAQEYEGGEGLE